VSKADDAKTQRQQTLGKLLREARHSRGWVLEDVAKKAGVSIPFLSDLERGKRVISPKRLHDLARALELSGADYIRLFQLRQRLPPKEERWFLQNPGLWKSAPKGALPAE
jgi:transcriptional regulator with XRE-family HTH domain